MMQTAEFGLHTNSMGMGGQICPKAGTRDKKVLSNGHDVR